jgi:hypothetical protein
MRERGFMGLIALLVVAALIALWAIREYGMTNKEAAERAWEEGRERGIDAIDSAESARDMVESKYDDARNR